MSENIGDFPRCLKCQRKFNDTEVTPYYLVPCWDSFCEFCIETMHGHPSKCYLCRNIFHNKFLNIGLIRQIKELDNISNKSDYSEEVYSNNIISGYKDSFDKKFYFEKYVNGKLLFKILLNTLA